MTPSAISRKTKRFKKGWKGGNADGGAGIIQVDELLVAQKRRRSREIFTLGGSLMGEGRIRGGGGGSARVTPSGDRRKKKKKALTPGREKHNGGGRERGKGKGVEHGMGHRAARILENAHPERREPRN